MLFKTKLSCIYYFQLKLFTLRATVSGFLIISIMINNLILSNGIINYLKHLISVKKNCVNLDLVIGTAFDMFIHIANV